MKSHFFARFCARTRNARAELKSDKIFGSGTFFWAREPNISCFYQTSAEWGGPGGL